ncbi:RNA methyltransferase [Paraphoma chrysanthemicola]|nr:RNA methyltransferase [Paraphoma chrysanthemicola]
MVFPSLLGSTLLRTQRLRLPSTFCRYKSITAAIERGQQRGPDRSSRPRTRDTPTEGGSGGKTRRELRFERFGKPRDDNDAPPRPARDDRPPRDGDRKVSAPRSSRFGRVGPPRSREDGPSRFRDDRPRDRDERPRREDRFNAAPDRDMTRGSRFGGERRSGSDRYGGERRPAFNGTDRPGRPDRFADRGERPPWQDRSSAPRTGSTWDRNNRFAESKPPFSGQDANRGPRTTTYDRGETRDGRTDTYPRRQGDDAGATGEVRRESRFSRPDSKGARREHSGRDEPRQSSYSSATTEPKHLIRDVESLPYSTAASEFVYGHSSVLAAIKANRRKLYSIYVHSRGASRDGLLTRIRAAKLFPITHEVGDEYLRALDKASSGRPHNGVVLESSPLPVPPITELRTASIEDESFSVALDSQSAEDLLVNGKQEVYSYKSGGWRHPLILYVDGVLDEGNLGAIARSAYFLGVDAVITPTHHTATWSHIAVKASAGAAEALPIFKVGQSTDFLAKSSRAGWRIYASETVPATPSIVSETTEEATSDVVYTFARSTKRLPADHSPVADHPTILMMGGEGAGLRTGLLNLAHYNVGIRHGRDVDEIGVDSLNVSVAASILCYEMLQKPKSRPTPPAEEVLF